MSSVALMATVLVSCADNSVAPGLSSNTNGGGSVTVSTKEVVLGPETQVKSFTIVPTTDNNVDWRVRPIGRGLVASPTQGRGRAEVTIRYAEDVPDGDRLYVGQVQIDVAASDAGRGGMQKTTPSGGVQPAEKRWTNVPGANVAVWYQVR